MGGHVNAYRSCVCVSCAQVIQAQLGHGGGVGAVEGFGAAVEQAQVACEAAGAGTRSTAEHEGEGTYASAAGGSTSEPAKSEEAQTGQPPLWKALLDSTGGISLTALKVGSYARESHNWCGRRSACVMYGPALVYLRLLMGRFDPRRRVWRSAGGVTSRSHGTPTPMEPLRPHPKRRRSRSLWRSGQRWIARSRVPVLQYQRRQPTSATQLMLTAASQRGRAHGPSR